MKDDLGRPLLLQGVEAGYPSRERYPGSPRSKVTRNTRGVPVPGPIPKFCDPRGRCGICTPRVRVSQRHRGTDQRRRVAAQGAGRRPRVRSCSPCTLEPPDAPLSSGLSAASGQLHAAGFGLNARAPPLAPLLGPRRTLSNLLGQCPGRATGTETGTGRGRVSGCSALRIPSSRRLDERSAAAFQVRADTSSRRRAAEGGLGTWAPL